MLPQYWRRVQPAFREMLRPEVEEWARRVGQVLPQPAGRPVAVRRAVVPLVERRSWALSARPQAAVVVAAAQGVAERTRSMRSN